MTSRRSAFSAALATALLAPATGALAQPATGNAERYPAKTVRLVVPFTPGAANDITARLIGTKLAESLGQQFVIDNRPGSGGILGAETVAKANADGYTLLASNPGPSINNPVLNRKPGYRVEDFAAAIIYGYTPLIIAAYPGFAPRNPRELVDHLKANPGKVTWGTSGTGGGGHIGLVFFQMATGTDVVHIPYKGAAAGLTDLAAGNIALNYTTLASADSLLKTGRLRIIGIAAPKRLSQLADVPTLGESGIRNAETIIWYGIAAPARTPQAIIGKLNREINRIIATPDAQARFAQLGIEASGGTPQEADAFIGKEAARLKELLRAGRLTALE